MLSGEIGKFGSFVDFAIARAGNVLLPCQYWEYVSQITLWHPPSPNQRLRISVATKVLEDTPAASQEFVASESVKGDAKACRFDVIGVQEVSGELRSDWDAIRSSSVAYRSPFFSHQFVESVGKVGSRVELAIATRNGRTVAILPFTRHRSSGARPVGAGINDAHGLLIARDLDLDLPELLRQCGLQHFAYHAAPPELPGMSEFEIGRTRAFLADLTVDSLGYEHYLCSRSHTVAKQGQKTRRMIRDLGPLRFEFDCRDTEMLQRLIDLKCQQYRRTHTFDILSVSWIRQLLYRMHAERGPGVRGVLNVLYAGENPVALHYGMIEGDLLHYWFPVFDTRYSYGSPGTQLFLEVARHAEANGFTAIDMGYGEQAYKHKLTNVITEMSYGLVDQNPVRRAAYRASMAVRERLKNWKYKDAVKPLVRKLVPSFGNGIYRS